MTECITKKAREARRWFTTEKTDRGPIVTLKEGRPEWVAGVVYECHDGRLPQDWIFEAVEEALCALDDNGGDVESARQSMEPDVYDYDLTEWSRAFPGYVDDAMKEARFSNHFDLLQYAQWTHKQEIFDTVLNALEVACDDDDDDNDD